VCSRTQSIRNLRSPMRYEKSETVLRIALDMQGSAIGLSLEDIQCRYTDRLRRNE
jgi:hypothetical protein